jgi:dTDP-4-amino-4,6-dideoxygalactose transaminase
VVLAAGFSFAATANAFLSLGASVYPVDVDVSTRNISTDALEAGLREHPEAAAIVVVDLYGSTAGTTEALELAERAGVPVIEDACQAHGARSECGVPVGSRALLTAFSFYATKNVSAGEGGLLTTADAELAERCRLLRNHGSRRTYEHETVGLNHRLPEMSAALARLRLAELENGNRRRLENARLVADWCRFAWPDAQVPATTGDGTHVFHQFTVALRDPGQRDEVQAFLRAAGVDARVHYPYTLSELPGVGSVAMPAAEWLRDRVLSLPVHPALTEIQLSALEEAIAAAGRATART